VSARGIPARAAIIFEADLYQVQTEANRVFYWLFLAQWAFAIALALIISPYAWTGTHRTLHFHVELAVIGGGVLNALPIALIRLRPGWYGTRHIVALTQMLWSAMFIHLTGGRIETHFHIFVSLAFLSFYRDPRLFITATLVVAADHLTVGFFWPESVYGIANPEWWRFMEHAAWVVFEDIILFLGCQRALREMHILSEREATLESGKTEVERQVAQRTLELTTSSERNRSLIENTSAIPWEVDAESCDIIYVAPQISTAFAAGPDIATHRNFLELFHPDDREEFKDFIKIAAAGDLKQKKYIDSRVLKTGNQVMHVRSFVADTGERASTNTVCGISLDVTQQKTMELELMQAQKLESIGQLSAGIAHEINTPTQFIGDNIRFLRESVSEVLSIMRRATPLMNVDAAATSGAELAGLLSSVDLPYYQEEIPKAIDQSLEGIERISTIVRAMKEFAHPAADRTLHDLNRAIANTITVASSEWKYVADIHTDFDADLPAVPVLPGAFNQVILNILVNAAHAVATKVAGTPGIKGSIFVSTRRIADWVEIRIRDSGGGIPESIRDRIFDPFFTTKEVGKGTGQGLAIAHDVIVNKHQGTIRVDSQIPDGTTFTVCLPLTNAPADSAVAA
jgi:signal transduction histidine kinase